MSGFRIDVDLSGLGMDQLADGAEAAVRPSAQAGAQVFYDQVKLNVRGIGRKTGNLDSSIYQVYSRDNSNKARAEYHISWNRKKAPHGHLVEFGHLQRYVTYIDKRGQWRTLFCGPAHRTAWHNRATVRGRVLTPLVMAEREMRGGTRGDTETGKAARRMACALMQQWKEEDKAAGRMSQAQYVRLRLKLGFD